MKISFRFDLVPDGEEDHENQEAVSLNKSSSKLAVGKTLTLTATGPSDIAFKSSNKSVATVSSSGKVKAKKPGTATITAYSKSNKTNKATCKITVKYKLSYKMNGGKNSAKNPTWYTGKVTLKNPGARTGYDFEGWYTDSKFKNKVTSVKNSNKTLYAKWKKNNKSIFINDFSTDVKESKMADVFDAIAKGKIEAEECGNEWVYKFTYGGYTVRIPVEFFRKSSTSSIPAWLNPRLSAALSDRKASKDSGRFIVNTGYPTAGTNPGTTITIDQLKVNMFKVTDNARSFDLKCKLEKTIVFDFSEKTIAKRGIEGNKTPSNKAEYENVLRRHKPQSGLSGNDDYKSLTPKFKVVMGTPEYYRGELYFNKFAIGGVGSFDSKKNIADLIKVATTSEKIISTLSKPLSFKTLSNLYGIYSNMDYSKESKQYINAGEDLDIEKDYCYGCEFLSPIELYNANDWIQFNITFYAEKDDIKGFKGTNTTIEFSLE